MVRRERDYKQLSREEFDRQAASYDSDQRGRHARLLEPVVLAAVEELTFSSALDVGCGTGRLLAAIAASRPGPRLYGIDLSPQMVAVARERLGAAAAVEVADAESLPFDDEQVDLVTCVDSFHHYPDPAAALAEMLRVTRPGGALVLGDWYVGQPFRGFMNWVLPRVPSGDVHIFTPDGLRALASGAGYEVERCEKDGVRAQLLVARRPR